MGETSIYSDKPDGSRLFVPILFAPAIYSALAYFVYSKTGVLLACHSILLTMITLAAALFCGRIIGQSEVGYTKKCFRFSAVGLVLAIQFFIGWL